MTDNPFFEAWNTPFELPPFERIRPEHFPPAFDRGMAEEAAEIKQLPGSLEEVLDALEVDHSFLLKGDVFTPDLIRTWIDYKRKNEVDAIRLRPHPWEFALYFDI